MSNASLPTRSPTPVRDPARLAAVADRIAAITPLTLARERTLAVPEPLQFLVGGTGLQRGSTVSVGGSGGALTLTFSLVAEAARQGSWVGVVGGPWLGLAAVEECGLPLERLVLVDRVEQSSWSTVAAAMLDGFDIVVLVHPERAGSRDARRLVSRTRERSSILIQVGGQALPEGADLRFEVINPSWSGIGQGHGHLQSRQATVLAGGRRGASRERQYRLWLPDSSGNCRLVESERGYAGSDVDQLVEAEEPTEKSTEERHLRRVV